MRVGELARKIHVSRIHAWRLAKSGTVPATKKTAGGHFFFVESEKLTRWINYMGNQKFRQKAMHRAYARYYGSDKLKAARDNRQLVKMFKEGKKDAESEIAVDYDRPEFYYSFSYFPIEMARMIQEYNQWPEGAVKEKVRQLSKKHLIILRNLINDWLRMP